MVTSIQESIISRRSVPNRAWNHCSPRRSTLLSGSHLLSTLWSNYRLVEVLMWRTLDVLHSTWRPNCRRLQIVLLAQKWTYSRRELREQTFIMRGRCSLSTQRSSTTSYASTERNRSRHPKASLPERVPNHLRKSSASRPGSSHGQGRDRRCARDALQSHRWSH